MSQPHPPIPEPQPNPHGSADDEPRTQSILLPPTQRPHEQRAPQPAPPAHAWPPPAEPPAEPAAPSAEPAAAPADPPSPKRPLPGQRPTGQLPAQPAPQPTVDPIAAAQQTTGPVDWVPGSHPQPPAGSTAATKPPPSSPAPSTAPGSAAASRPSQARRSPVGRVHRAGRGSVALLAVVLGVSALALLELGLSLNFGTRSLWEVVPAWATFATLATLVVLFPAAGVAGRRVPSRTAWRVGAAGAAGLAAFWVLVALPLVASDRGFWLTAALALAGAALWLAPGRAE
jgi:hypothetical protein